MYVRWFSTIQATIILTLPTAAHKIHRPTLAPTHLLRPGVAEDQLLAALDLALGGPLGHQCIASTRRRRWHSSVGHGLVGVPSAAEVVYAARAFVDVNGKGAAFLLALRGLLKKYITSGTG